MSLNDIFTSIGSGISTVFSKIWNADLIPVVIFLFQYGLCLFGLVYGCVLLMLIWDFLIIKPLSKKFENLRHLSIGDKPMPDTSAVFNIISRKTLLITAFILYVAIFVK